MNHSVSTMTGKTKLKLVLLGTQNVGKSSIIDKYIHNKFDETANVPAQLPSPLLAWTFLPRTSATKLKTIVYSSGTLQGKRDFFR